MFLITIIVIIHLLQIDNFLKYFYIRPLFSLSLFSQDFSLHDFALIHMPKINSITICFNRSNYSIIKAHSNEKIHLQKPLVLITPIPLEIPIVSYSNIIYATIHSSSKTCG